MARRGMLVLLCTLLLCFTPGGVSAGTDKDATSNDAGMQSLMDVMMGMYSTGKANAEELGKALIKLLYLLQGVHNTHKVAATDSAADKPTTVETATDKSATNDSVTDKSTPAESVVNNSATKNTSVDKSATTNSATNNSIAVNSDSDKPVDSSSNSTNAGVDAETEIISALSGPNNTLKTQQGRGPRNDRPDENPNDSQGETISPTPSSSVTELSSDTDNSAFEEILPSSSVLPTVLSVIPTPSMELPIASSADEIYASSVVTTTTIYPSASIGASTNHMTSIPVASSNSNELANTDSSISEKGSLTQAPSPPSANNNGKRVSGAALDDTSSPNTNVTEPAERNLNANPGPKREPTAAEPSREPAAAKSSGLQTNSTASPKVNGTQEPVPGPAGEWGPWTPCSPQCGGCGTRKRVRDCSVSGCSVHLQKERCGFYPCPSRRVSVKYYCYQPVACPLLKFPDPRHSPRQSYQHYSDKQRPQQVHREATKYPAPSTAITSGYAFQERPIYRTVPDYYSRSNHRASRKRRAAYYGEQQPHEGPRTKQVGTYNINIHSAPMYEGRAEHNSKPSYRRQPVSYQGAQPTYMQRPQGTPYYDNPSYKQPVQRPPVVVKPPNSNKYISPRRTQPEAYRQQRHDSSRYPENVDKRQPGYDQTPRVIPRPAPHPANTKSAVQPAPAPYSRYQRQPEYPHPTERKPDPYRQEGHKPKTQQSGYPKPDDPPKPYAHPYERDAPIYRTSSDDCVAYTMCETMYDSGTFCCDGYNQRGDWCMTDQDYYRWYSRRY